MHGQTTRMDGSIPLFPFERGKNFDARQMLAPSPLGNALFCHRGVLHKPTRYPVNSSDRVTIEIFTGQKPLCTSVCVCVYARVLALPTSLATFNILPTVSPFSYTREQDFTTPLRFLLLRVLASEIAATREGGCYGWGVIAKLRDGGNCQGSLLETWMLVDGFDENAFREFYVKIIRGGEGDVRGKLGSKLFRDYYRSAFNLSPVEFYRIVAGWRLPRDDFLLETGKKVEKRFGWTNFEKLRIE